jgi:hypothetical protein
MPQSSQKPAEAAGCLGRSQHVAFRGEELGLGR